MQSREKKVVVIGAGPSGLFAARALNKQGVKTTILEKEKVVGGKCHTYSDPNKPDLKTEWGAGVLAANYGVVLDAVEEKGIEFEEMIHTNDQTVEIKKRMSEMSATQKVYFAAQFAGELAKFTYYVSQYHYARDHQLPLPEDFEIPFKQFADKYGIQDINSFLKPFVTGFGYGAMDDIPAYSVFEYMGVGTIPSMLYEGVSGRSALMAVKGGTQHLMEKVAEDLDVVTEANVQSIERNDGHVEVTYTHNGVTQKVEGDALVLATSPLQWTKMGMQLTPVEQECVDQLTYYRYPVAVCHVDNLIPEQAFVPPALEKEGFGHLSLITLRDNRQNPIEGRLLTGYINLPQGKNDFSLDEGSEGRNVMMDELSHLGGLHNVKVDATKIWEDYMPSLTWQQRLKLDKEQMRADNSTLYVGAYPLGGFEDVRCVSDQATRAVKRHFFKDESQDSTFNYVSTELSRAYGFFYRTPRRQPVDDSVLESTRLAENNARRPAFNSPRRPAA